MTHELIRGETQPVNERREAVYVRAVALGHPAQRRWSYPGLMSELAPGDSPLLSFRVQGDVKRRDI
jgi:hypothetical protein